MLANANTGLLSNDVFYFGNAVADMNVGNEGTPSTISVDYQDSPAVRKNLSLGVNSVGIANILDVNKDGRVNAIDVALVRQSQSVRSIRLFTASVSLRLSVLGTSMRSVELGIPALTTTLRMQKNM